MFNRRDGASTEKPNAYRMALRAMWPALAGVALFSAMLNMLMLTGSIYMLQIYDRVLSSGSIPTLVGLFSVVVILYCFLGLYDFLRMRLLSRAALRLDDSLGSKAFDRSMRAGLPATVTRSGGRGVNNAAALQDLSTLRGFLSSPAITALADIPFVPLFLTVLFFIHPWLGWLTVGGACVAALVALVNRMLIRTSIQDSRALDGAERDFTDRSRRSAETIFSMGMYHAIAGRWRDLHDKALVSSQRGSDPSEMLAAGSRSFKMLLQSAILTLGALLVLRGEISAGMIIASSILSGRALAPVDQFIGQWRSIGMGIAAHRRLSESFAVDLPAPQRVDLPDPTGKIVVSGLTKLVPGGLPGQPDAPRILSNVSFALNPGDAMGVIGKSASGKTTFARLLAGAMEADAGEIRLDGATREQWDPVQLGRKIGYLPQVLEMLPGSIRDNIARFDPEASDEAVIAAARMTGIHDMILKLPDGYGTQMCNPAAPAPLSGGQMQRLGLARAIYGLPRIVVLDEPNSNLDMAGDKALTRTIKTLRDAGSTVIVMAHRSSALTAVNKLMVLDAGVVQKFGDRDVVLAAEYKDDNVAASDAAVALPTPIQGLADLRARKQPQAAKAVATAERKKTVTISLNELRKCDRTEDDYPLSIEDEAARRYQA